MFEKLKSRKLWITIGSLLAIFFGEAPMITQIVAGLGTAAYVLSQAFVDGKAEIATGEIAKAENAKAEETKGQ